MLLGGAVAGQGEIDIYLLMAIAWFSAWAGDTTSFFIGRRLGRGFRPAPRAAVRDHSRALRAGRGLLRPPRRQDDPDRALHQPGAGAGAVHRRQLGNAIPGLRPLQHPRHRSLVDRPHPDRLLLLAQHRHRSAIRGPGRLPARDADRRRGRDRPRGALPAGAREPPPRRSRWMEARWRPAGSSPGAAARAAGPVLLGPADSRRHLRPRVHDPDVAVLAVGLFVLVSYTVIVSGDPGPTPGDMTALRRRREHPGPAG